MNGCETFVTRKITGGTPSILDKREKYIYLGDLYAKRDAKRDWGYAPEYVECLWQMLQNKKPEDFVLGTGETHLVREFIEAAFSYVGLNLEKYVKIDPRYLRPPEVEMMIADPTKARKKLGWNPKIKFKDLVKIMVDVDMRAVGLESIGEGHKIIKKKFSNRWGEGD